MKQKANEADQQSDLRDAFKIFDRDNNGYIDMKELKQVSMPPNTLFFFYLINFYVLNKHTHTHSFFLDRYVVVDIQFTKKMKNAFNFSKKIRCLFLRLPGL